jgi:putative flavoprotein involved in K+ transport
MRARGEFVIGTSRRQLEKAGVRIRPRLVAAHGRTATFSDGGTLDVDAVVWATGYRSDHSWLHVPGVVVDGQVRHTAGVTEVPGLYFLGLPWQTCRGSALLGFVGADAATLSARMAADAHEPTTTDIPEPAAYGARRANGVRPRGLTTARTVAPISTTSAAAASTSS